MSGSTGWRQPAWLRWLIVPWSELALALALISAAATPAFVLAASDVWRDAAADQVTAGVMAGTTDTDAGIDVRAEAVFSGLPVSTADSAVSARLSAIDQLGEPVTTMFTYIGQASVGGDPRTSQSARLFSRLGVENAVNIIKMDESIQDGVLISSWLADHTGLELGSSIDFESEALTEALLDDPVPAGGASTSFTVSGIYEPLWSEVPGDLPSYWDDVDPALIPRYLTPFRAPNFEVLIMAPSTLAGSGVSGVVQWAAPAKSVPVTHAELTHLGSQYRTLEASFVQDSDLSSVLASMSGAAPRRVLVETQLAETIQTVDMAISQLDQPLALVRVVGLVVALLVTIAIGVFLVERRRVEYRLLSGEGERWWRISTRTAVQILPVDVGGAAIGVISGVAIARLFGPAETLRWSSIHLAPLLILVIAALAITSVVVGFVGERTLDDDSRRKARSVVPALTVAGVLASVLLWFQAGRTSSLGADGIDLEVVALPVIAIAAAVLVAVGMLRSVLALLLRRFDHFALDALFAIRRVTSGGRTMQLVGAALGFGIGMTLFSLMLVGSLGRTIDVKMATEIGGETRLDLFGPIGDGLDLPDGSTVLMVQDTRITPGNGRVRVVAIDHDSFASAVDWPSEFGSSAEEIVSLLQTDAGGDLPVVAINGQPVPDEAGLGIINPFPFQVVGRVNSLPLASEVGSTLLIDASKFDALVLDQLAVVAGVPRDDPDLLAQFHRPTDRFRRHVISHDDPIEVKALVEAGGMGVRSESTRDVRLAGPDIVAARTAFEYLGLLGYVASAVAIAALMLHLSARRRATALASVMLRKMGLRRSRAALITVFEMGALTLVVSVAALVSASLLVRRVAGRFDPAPRLPPDVAVDVPILWDITAVVGAVLVVALIAYSIDISVLRRSDAQAVRDGA